MTCYLLPLEKQGDIALSACCSIPGSSFEHLLPSFGVLKSPECLLLGYLLLCGEGRAAQSRPLVRIYEQGSSAQQLPLDEQALGNNLPFHTMSNRSQLEREMVIEYSSCQDAPETFQSVCGNLFCCKCIFPPSHFLLWIFALEPGT